MKVAIIGGGAAGFFAAFSCRKHHPDADITIYEKTSKLLQKVKVSGGGRCNVTHDARNISNLVKHYPRGERQLRKCFGQLSVNDTIDWFAKRGVKLKTEEDNRMFPTTDDSQTIIDCFLKEAHASNIKIENRANVEINDTEEVVHLAINGEVVKVDKLIIASGGSPKIEGFNWLKDIGHQISPPVPSLFTFNIPNDPITKLMGVSVENVTAKIIGSKLQYSGSLLVTHWGLSGPAILKLSAWGARYLNDQNYNFTVQINWTGDLLENDLRDHLSQFVNSKKKLINQMPVDMPSRLWSFLLFKIEVDENLRWIDIGKKVINKMVNVLTNDQYQVKGKTTFKEEFVTCGGVALEDVDFNTMQSRKVKNLYFAGEVLDVDGITGGFNFQAAWSTGYVAGKLK